MSKIYTNLEKNLIASFAVRIVFHFRYLSDLSLFKAKLVDSYKLFFTNLILDFDFNIFFEKLTKSITFKLFFKLGPKFQELE